MNVKLLTEHHLESLRSKGGSTGSFESTLVKIPHCWKSHVAAQILSMALVHIRLMHSFRLTSGFVNRRTVMFTSTKKKDAQIVLLYALSLFS